ncbi:MAG: hypothetical protein GTN97_04425 [Nitrosopumilaceae archaeon]|nr:hypothetical protein [Nitrosopumilaceae archaeon]NIP10285.1 hypothetical protein [Nitrosopumilaceae archaeon]NIS95148.1 hypothetical protein [Nitrosopumilaceae archaeon]
MSVDPKDYENPEMEIWLLTYLYYHRRDQSVVSRDLIEDIPQSLLKTLPKQDHLHYMVTRFIRAGYFKEAIGTFRAGSNYHLFITDKGIMEFRKQLSPLFQTCKDNQKLEKIINENVGSTELKNTIIEFFEKNKNCNEDEFDSRLHEFTNFLGKESVIWIFKLILASSR